MPVTHVERQVKKAARRLFVQTLLDTLAWCWAGALFLSIFWFFAQPWLLGETEDSSLRWLVAGGLFLGATLLGVWLSYRRAPSRVEAALELDLRFQLKERATSSLTLVPELSATAAGVALAADAEAHLAKLDVKKGFPVRLKRPAMLVPALALALTIVAMFYDPELPSAAAARQRNANKAANAKEIAQRIEKLQTKPKLQWPKDERNEKLEEIEKLRDKILSQKFDPANKDHLREQLQKFVPLEDKIKDRIENRLAQDERNQAMKDALQDMGKDSERKLSKEGPAKDLQDALNKGDLDKAQQELQKLADNLKDSKLSDEEQKRLQDQLDEIQQKLGDLAEMKDFQQQLKSEQNKGNLTQEEVDRLMAKALDDAELLKDLKEFSGKLKEMKFAPGDAKSISAKLADLAKDLRDLDPDSLELLLLEEQARLLGEAKLAMQQGLGGNMPGRGEGDGKGDAIAKSGGGDGKGGALAGMQQGIGAAQGGMGSGPLPGGKRQFAKDGKTGSKDERQKGDPSQLHITGLQKGGIFTKIPPAQVGGAFQQAQQDAPQAIDRQQVPPDAADVLRGYYQNLGGGKKK